MTEKQVKMLLAAKLYEQGKLSLGKAAEMAGYSKWTFMELLPEYGVSYFNYSPEDLKRDILNVERRYQ